MGISATPSGNGYWLVAADGTIYGFGDAVVVGSTWGIARHPIVGMAPTVTGIGYWLVDSARWPLPLRRRGDGAATARDRPPHQRAGPHHAAPVVDRHQRGGALAVARHRPPHHRHRRGRGPAQHLGARRPVRGRRDPRVARLVRSGRHRDPADARGARLLGAGERCVRQRHTTGSVGVPEVLGLQPHRLHHRGRLPGAEGHAARAGRAAVRARSSRSTRPARCCSSSRTA